MEAKPKIFVSTVTKELKSAREKVAATLRMLHFEPVFQEEFSSHTGVVRATLEKELQPCVAVIQIVGHRYGWDVYDAENPSESMSYTHYEARYAHLHHLPIWYLVIADDYAVDAPNDEDADKKALQTAYRVRVRRTGHLHYAVSDVKDVELTIYRMLFDLDELRPEAKRWLRNGGKDGDASGGGGGSPSGTPDQPVSPPASKQELETMMRGVLREMVPALQQVRQGTKPEDSDQREDDFYIRLGTMLGTEPEQARKELEAVAQRLRADKTEPPMERAKAAYALKNYDQAHQLFLEAASAAALQTPPDIDGQINALKQAGKAAEKQVHYVQAMEHYRAAAALTSTDRDFLQWLDLQNGIGWLHYLQGRYPDGLAHCKQVWSIAQQAGHDEAPAVLMAHMGYASALDDNGQAAAAEPEYRAVLKVMERVLGAEHPATLGSRNNLALALDAQGKNAEAEQEHRAVLKIRERLVGAEHPATLTSQSNLASALQAQGKNAEAEQEHRTRIMVEERVLGAEHPDTLASRMNLAKALGDQGKYAEEEKEHRAVLKVQERVLGAEHPDVAMSRYNLALCLEDQNQLPEALAFMHRAEQIRTKVLGPDHPLTKSTKLARERIEAALAQQKPARKPKKPKQGAK